MAFGHNNQMVSRIHSIQVGPSWMDPLVVFLRSGSLPEDKIEAEKIRRKAPWNWLSEERKLYKRSYLGPYLLCIHPEVVEPLLEELHEGICGSHTGEGPYHVELLSKGIGGQTCKMLPRIMLKNVTSVRGTLQISINLEKSLIHFPILGRLLNGA